MIKKDDKEAKKRQSSASKDNGHVSAKELLEAVAQQIQLQLEPIIKTQRDIEERQDEADRRSSVSNAAQLLVAERVFNTDRRHLPEMTVVSLRMIDPLRLAGVCAAVLDDEVQDGVVSLGEISSELVLRYLRSVKGNLVQKGFELALRQEEQRPEGSFDEAELGKGL